MSSDILARFQFAFTSAFHYIFPPITIGLGLLLVIMEGLYLKTGKELYHKMTRFWVLIYALNFGVGVATGIPLEFQFGMNWSKYSRFVGDIFGSALAAEGIFAFFLESGFLGILVFGWNRVSKGMHFFATIMVFLGSVFSAVWILVANSWQQTPSAYKLTTLPDGTTKALITDFWGLVFNPSSVDRFTHTVLGAFLTGAMLVTSVAAYYLLKKRHEEFAMASLKIAVPVAFLVCVLQVFSGHDSLVGVARNQPTKFAAMEGWMDQSKPLDITVIGYYDEATKSAVGLKIPGIANSLLDDQAKQALATMKDKFGPDDYPKIQPVFQAFHIMVAIGFFLLFFTGAAWIQLLRGRLQDTRWMLQLFVPAVVLPHIANQTGWLTAELGRQPWAVYGLLRTSESASPVVNSGMLIASLIMFVVMYAFLGFLYVYLLNKKIKAGPDLSDDSSPLIQPQHRSGVA